MRPGVGQAGPTAAATLGALFALWLYGRRAVDPAWAAWLLHGDPAQHYLGSVFFLSEGWQWPPGLIRRLGEQPTSLVFTDALPLLALPAKLLGVTPGLQYFGLWMVACHALAGWFGWRLLWRVGLQGGFRLGLGALFFVAAPAMLLRAYGHEALMAHFLGLAALERALAPWRLGGWLLVWGASVWVHPYIALMTGLIGGGAMLAARAEGVLTWARLLGQGAAALVLLWAMAWVAGYFVGSGDLSAAGHGFFSANLLTWFDPMPWQAFLAQHGKAPDPSAEWSAWLPGLKQATAGQYEGFAYLGAGMLVVLALWALSWIRRPARPDVSVGHEAISRARWIALWAAAVFLMLLAVSARPSVGSVVLAEVPLSAGVERMLGVFRASGRFIWPMTYLLMAVSLARVGNWRWGGLLLAACLLVQAQDQRGKFREFRERFRNAPVEVERAVTDPVWAQALAKCPMLEFVTASHPPPRWIPPALAAGLAGARFQPAPTARYSPQQAQARQQELEQLLASQGWQPGRVYVLAAPLPGGRDPAAVTSQLPQGFAAVTADGYTLVLPQDCRGS